jgi:hypothetical protein
MVSGAVMGTATAVPVAAVTCAKPCGVWCCVNNALFHASAATNGNAHFARSLVQNANFAEDRGFANIAAESIEFPAKTAESFTYPTATAAFGMTRGDHAQVRPSVHSRDTGTGGGSEARFAAAHSSSVHALTLAGCTSCRPAGKFSPEDFDDYHPQ